LNRYSESCDIAITTGKRLPSVGQHNFCWLLERLMEVNITFIGWGRAVGRMSSFRQRFGPTEVTALIPRTRPRHRNPHLELNQSCHRPSRQRIDAPPGRWPTALPGQCLTTLIARPDVYCPSPHHPGHPSLDRGLAALVAHPPLCPDTSNRSSSAHAPPPCSNASHRTCGPPPRPGRCLPDASSSSPQRQWPILLHACPDTGHCTTFDPFIVGLLHHGGNTGR
jgi:hypothetical protein